MTIYEQLKDLLQDEKGYQITAAQIKALMKEKYGTNASSIIPSDYCYNRCNDGIDFDKHIFEYLGRNTYKYLGEGFPYSGKIFHKPVKQKFEKVLGEWINGNKIMY